MSSVMVIGAGLAGCEAAWQLARRGIAVDLLEMKPEKFTPAHTSPYFAELVCSNSLRSDRLENAVGLLKQELRLMGSLIMEGADATKVEAGGALAVDREGFSQFVTRKIQSQPNIRVITGELATLDVEGDVIVATGPLTGGGLAASIQSFFGGQDYLSFYDAAAPLVAFDSVDMDRAYFASRYDRGSPDYINCPMDKEQYLAFWQALCEAEEAQVHGFEDKSVFEGCMPVEVMARRGEDTLRFGPLKPVGLKDPKTGKEPYAVVQLRKDNALGSIYNLVGFQTHLKFGEQKRVFSMIPALKYARYERYGVMHRNTYINSPLLLNQWYQTRKDGRVSFAGQITGVEGYVESTASGLVAGISTARRLQNKPPLDLSQRTAVGALAHYISNPEIRQFQPMNINFGLLEPLEHRVRGKQAKNLELARRALEEIRGIVENDFYE